VKRPFTPHEDAALMSLMGREADVDWEAVANKMEGRSARQCRERWVNYLAPTIRNDSWTEDENRLLVDKINELGHCWAKIGHFFNGRSQNDVKNRWYSHLKFRSTFDPILREWALAPGETCPMFPDRKKRQRVKVLPQQNAMRILEQQKCAYPFFVPPAMERLPPVRPPNPVLPDPTLDVMDDVLAFGFGEERQATDSEFFSNDGFGFDP
jgi:hypothetical protein